MLKNVINNIKKIKISFFSEALILMIIALSPLYFNYFYASSIDLNKMVFFRVLLLLLLFFSVWRFAFTKLQFYKNKVLAIVIPVGVLFLALAISLVFSVDFNSSWFGLYGRSEGFISWLFYGLWLILLIFNLNGVFEDLSRLKRLLIAISLSAAIVSLYAIFQLFGVDFFTWSEPAYLTKRAFSSFGQPNYLACWLVMVMPISVYLWHITKPVVVRFIYLILFLLQLVALFATGSRSSFLAFFIISFVFIITFYFKEKGFSKKNFIILMVGIFSFLIIFATALFITNPTRLTEFKDFKKGSMGVRVELWRTGFDAFLKKPLFGYGLENQKEAYVKYYQVDWALYARPNTYSDRAHNLPLDILLTTGIFGLAAFTYLLWSIFSILYKSYSLQNNKFSAFLIWSLASYLFVLLFNFSVTVTNIYFWLFIALAFISAGPIFKEREEKYSPAGSYLTIFIALIVLFYGIVIETKTLEADYYYNEAIKSISEKQYFSALVYNDYLLETNPNSLIKNYYGQAISLRLLESLPLILDRSSQFVVNKYLSEFNNQIINPDFESRFVKAFILGVTGKRAESEDIFSEIALKSPYLPKIYLAWGDVYMLNNNFAKAQVKFEKAKSLLPDLNNSYLNVDQKKNLVSYNQLIENRLNRTNLLINKK